MEKIIPTEQKEKKEDSMEQLQCARFEEGLNAIRKGIEKKAELSRSIKFISGLGA